MTGVQGRSGKHDNHKRWSTEAVAQLRELLAANFGPTIIGRRMGLTRNAIIGKMHRMGLTAWKAPATTRPARRARNRTTRAAHPPRPVNRNPQPPRLDLGAITDFPPDQSDCAVDILGLTDATCRWPLGTPPNITTYCGTQPVPGLPYCSRHACLAYRWQPVSRPVDPYLGVTLKGAG